MRSPVIHRALFAISLSLAGALGTDAAAEPTLELRVSGPKEVFPGDPVSSSVDALGRITTGPEIISLGEMSEYSIVTLIAGKNAVYAGTAGGGLFRVDGSGRSARKLFDEEKMVVSAVVEHEGMLYAATSPEGRIFQIPSKGGKRPFADPSAKYIWAMLGDGDGLLVATGEPGRIVRVAPGGSIKVVFDPEETHVRALARHPKRGIIAGTGQKGIVLQIDDTGRAYALYDSALDEVTSIAIDEATGDIYASLVSETEKGKFIPGRSIGPVAKEKKETGSPIKSSEVVRIAPDGRVDLLWTSRREGALALAFEPREGALFIATGTGPDERGRVYAIDTKNRDRLRLWARTEPALASAIALTPKNHALVVGTGPSGQLLRLGPGPSRKAVYISEEQDLHRVARLGRIWFDAEVPPGAAVTLAVRTGNTAKYGNTWSDWSKTTAIAEGAPIDVPRAQFAQFKVELTASGKGVSPIVKSMHASIVRMNVAPEVNEVFLLYPGVYMRAMPQEEEKEKSLTLNKAAIDRLRSYRPDRDDTRVRQGVKPGWMTAAWDASDRNGDSLVYRLEIQRLDAPGTKSAVAWRELVADAQLAFHSFDSRALPDGRYQLRLTATDRPSNPPEESLTDHHLSEPFTIDNQPPAITSLMAKSAGPRALSISATAEDSTSLLGFAEVSIDGGPWLMFPAADGLTDSKNERLAVVIRTNDEPGSPKIDKGRHTVSVRVEDELGNAATASTFVNVP